MRVLLDEDLPIQLRLHFAEAAKVETVEYRGWKGQKNGAVLRAAEGHFRGDCPSFELARPCGSTLPSGESRGPTPNYPLCPAARL